MSAQSPRPTDSDRAGSWMTRRDLFKRSAVVGGSLVAIGGGVDRLAPRYSPVGRAQAIPPAIIVGVGAVAATSLLVGGLTTSDANTGSDGLTPEALKQDVYETLRTRHSTYSSTLHDNEVIIDGMSHIGYTEGKIAGIEALNEQKSQSEVLDAIHAAVNEYGLSVQRNFVKSFQEMARELDNMIGRVQEHPDVSFPGPFIFPYGWDSDKSYDGIVSRTIELTDGSDYEYDAIKYSDGTSGRFFEIIPTNSSEAEIQVEVGDKSTMTNPAAKTEEVWNQMDTTLANVKSGLSTWLDGVYSDVQAGDLDVSDLVTPRERAEMMSEDEDISMAIADLVALNIPADFEREAHLTYHGSDRDSKIIGTIAITTPPENGIQAGETYDPATLEGSVMFTYDVSRASSNWTSFDDDSGVDGGVVTFTTDPLEDVVYQINTAAGEQATVTAEDFEEDTDAGTWTVDVSDQLDNAITDIEKIEMAAEDGEAKYETITLEDEFTVNKFVDSDGDEHDSADFNQTESQDDSNYITQEEWDAMKKRNEELIEKYEESQEEDDGPLFGGIFDGGLGGGGGGLLGLGIIGVVILAVIGIVTDAIPGLGN